MTKVLLDYDPATGQMKSENGLFIGAFIGLQPYEGADKPKVDDRGSA